MDIKKTVLRVSISCMKCKKEVLKAVTKLEGIDEVSVNSEKGQLTVIGNVDPVLLTKKLRGAKKYAEIISVGPYKKEKKEEEKKCLTPLPICCRECQHVGVAFAYDPPLCSLL